MIRAFRLSVGTVSLITILGAMGTNGYAFGHSEEPQGSIIRDQIVDLAKNSSCAKVRWKDRGASPAGYVPGMALTFGRSLCRLKGLGADAGPAQIMARTKSGAQRSDALAWFNPEFERLNIKTRSSSAETLKAVYTLATGLGMRESTGRHTIGFDVSVRAQTSKTAEAGLFQTSYNSLAFSKELRKLYQEYLSSQNRCFLETFTEGVLDCPQKIIGTGDGAKFQRLSKQCPAFTAESVAVMLRLGRKHYGPINRKEAEIKTACMDLYDSVESLIERDPESACQDLR
jgi:hypothetical protein